MKYFERSDGSLVLGSPVLNAWLLSVEPELDGRAPWTRGLEAISLQSLETRQTGPLILQLRG